MRETSNVVCSERLAELKEVLNLTNLRWRVAGKEGSVRCGREIRANMCGTGEYLRYVEATEFHLATAIR